MAIFISVLRLYKYERYKERLIKPQEEKMSRVLISMPEKFLDEIDKVAGAENRSRSELIREALRTYIYKQKVRQSTTSARNAELLESMLE